jgi:hypothetical protein
MTVQEYLGDLQDDQRHLALTLLQAYIEKGEVWVDGLPPSFKSVGLSFEGLDDGSLKVVFHFKTELSQNAINSYIN